MIWIGARGVADRSSATVSIDEAHWRVAESRQSAGRRTWPLLIYQRAPGVSSVKGLDLRTFVRDAVIRGVVSPLDYLISVEAGYEIRSSSGRPGLTTRSFSVAAVSGTPVGAIPSPIAHKCLDDWQDSAAAGNLLDVYSCNGSAAQDWRVSIDGAIQIAVGRTVRCIGPANGATTQGTNVSIQACNGSPAQVWEPGSGGALWNQASGMCLADPQASTGNGTQVVIWPCDGGAEQHWALPRN
jgi:hypothetical protein